MALACRVLLTVRNTFAGRFNFLALPSSSHHLNCHNESSSNPLLIKLLQVSISRLRTTLDQEFCSIKSSGSSWESLVTCLRPSSPEKARLVLEWVLEKLLKDNEKNHSAFSEYIFHCGQLQNVPLAMQAFASMEANGIKPTSLVFNSLINACLCSNDIITSFSLFEIMESSESYKPDSHTYNTFITAFSMSGNFDAMLAWYSAKKAAGFGPDLQTFESLISGCIKSRNFESANEIYEEMLPSEITPSISILENMLEGLCKQKSLGRAEEFFKYVKGVRWEISENMTDKLMALYQEIGQVEKMEKFLETMKSHPVANGVLSRIHCGVIQMYAKLDRLDDVEFAVGRMLKQGLSFTSVDDVEKVICSYFRREAYDRLDIFLECIGTTSHTLSRSTYDLLISGYRRAGLLEKVDSMINVMKSAGVT